MSQDEPKAGEVLVLDADESVRQALRRLLEGVGMKATLASELGQAHELLVQRPFVAMLCDPESLEPGQATAFIAEARQRSPMTALLLLTSRRSFDVAAEAFRAGASDVILKSPDQVDYLRSRVVAAAAQLGPGVPDDAILAEAVEIHEEFVRRLMEASRRLYALEETVDGGEASGLPECVLLVVDDGGSLQAAIERAIRRREGWRLLVAANGGAALDVSQPFHIAIVKGDLPDLPGSMVARTLKTNFPSALALLFTAATDTPGKVEFVEHSRLLPFLPECRDPGELAPRLDELREAYDAKERERRFLGRFRTQHLDLLRRCAEIKKRAGSAPGQ